MPVTHPRPSWDSSSLGSRPWAGWGSQSVVGVGSGQCLSGVCSSRRYVALVTLRMPDMPFPKEFYFRNALRSASTTAPCDLAEPATPWPGGWVTAVGRGGQLTSGETWLRAKPLIIGVKTQLGQRCDSLHIKKNKYTYIEMYPIYWNLCAYNDIF